MERQRRVRSSESRRRAADAGRLVVPGDDDGGEDGGGGDEAGGVGRGTSNAGRIEEGEMRQFTNPLGDGKMT